MYRFLAHFSFTWLLGKALVRRVSCTHTTAVSSSNTTSAGQPARPQPQHYSPAAILRWMHGRRQKQVEKRTRNTVTVLSRTRQTHAPAPPRTHTTQPEKDCCRRGGRRPAPRTCVSSMGRLRGTLSTKALWSGVAAQAVMRKPASQRRWMPSEGYWKSSSTHCAVTQQRSGGGGQ